MLRYECDFCHRLKDKDETWILGFAAESVGLTAARREVAIMPAWDDARAVDYLAVHFCCEQCRQNYMANLFGEEPAEGKIIEEVTVGPRKRIVREFSDGAVETRVVRRTTKPAKSRGRRRRKAA
jgi:hypothetical protein